jgi:gamma-butyrobetaine dioxygenase
VIARWDWDATEGPGRVLAELAASGIAWIRAPQIVEAASREPWEAAAQLLGERPELVERQPIRPIPGGRSFASGTMAAPFHSDSQTFLGVPPAVQVMACRQAAPAGGESLYLDAWPVIAIIEREAPELFARLFDAPRRFPFVFGDFFGPTVSLRGGSLVFTHTAFPEEGDGVAAALAPFLESTAAIEVRAEAGDLLVAHNHRLLHGRRAFDGGRGFEAPPAGSAEQLERAPRRQAGVVREFTRLLVWRREVLPCPEGWRMRAERAVAVAKEGLSGAPRALRERFGLVDSPDPGAGRRLRAVLDLLRGVPAGVLAVRESVPELELYRWRSAALCAGLTALAVEPDHADDRDVHTALAQLVARARRPV